MNATRRHITDIIFLEPLIFLCTDVISLYIYLDPALLILDIDERCFSHITECHDTTCNRNFLVFHRFKVILNILAVSCHIPFFNKKWVSVSILQILQFLSSDLSLFT